MGHGIYGHDTAIRKGARSSLPCLGRISAPGKPSRAWHRRQGADRVLLRISHAEKLARSCGAQAQRLQSAVGARSKSPPGASARVYGLLRLQGGGDVGVFKAPLQVHGGRIPGCTMCTRYLQSTGRA